MSDKTVTMSRELAERLIRAIDEPQPSPLYAELRKLLDAPVVERQEPVEAILLSGCVELNHKAYGPGYFSTEVTMLYTSPPAPVAVVLPTDDDAEVAFEHSKFHGHDVFFAGFYAAIDKVKELNQ